MIKQYNSFEEIDNRLKILNLQRKIDKENLKLNLKSSKIDLSPSVIIDDFNSFIQKKIINWAIKSIQKIFKNTKKWEK